MAKPKKDKRISFNGSEFVIATTVTKPGVRPRTLHGRPTIATTPQDVRIGCIRITREALRAIVALAENHRDYTVVHQAGNYGDPEPVEF